MCRRSISKTKVSATNQKVTNSHVQLKATALDTPYLCSLTSLSYIVFVRTTITCFILSFTEGKILFPTEHSSGAHPQAPCGSGLGRSGSLDP